MVKGGFYGSVLLGLADLYSNKDCNSQPCRSPTLCVSDDTFVLLE